jgi:transcriptional regulator with XRE-family HTH domain
VPTFSTQNQNDPTLAAIGAAIRRIRTGKGMSQEGLALLADVDRTYIGNVERGQSNVAVLVLFRIAKALDTSLTLLLKEAGVE